MKILLTAALAACLIAPAPTPAAAQTNPGTGRPTVDLKVCNDSGRAATVAVSYVPVGENRFLNRGWFGVSNGACIDLVSTDNANFYFYADAMDGSGRHWGGDHTLCVEYPGPYTFYSEGDECEGWQELRGFVPFHAEEAGSWTWALDP